MHITYWVQQKNVVLKLIIVAQFRLALAVSIYVQHKINSLARSWLGSISITGIKKIFCTWEINSYHFSSLGRKPEWNSTIISMLPVNFYVQHKINPLARFVSQMTHYFTVVPITSSFCCLFFQKTENLLLCASPHSLRVAICTVA